MISSKEVANNCIRLSVKKNGEYGLYKAKAQQVWCCTFSLKSKF